MGSAFMDDMMLDCCIMSDKLLSELETDVMTVAQFEANMNLLKYSQEEQKHIYEKLKAEKDAKLRI